MRIEAVIFDMDGVLADSESLICAAASAMFAERGVTVQQEDFTPFVGAGENRYIGGVAEKYGLALDLAAAKARTYALYLALVPDGLVMFPGADTLVLQCQHAGLKVAVASSADRIKIDANLEAIGLPPQNWDAVVSGEDLVHLKPAPDLFLEAARRMLVPPRHCVVIEDAVNGVQAAKAAGMRCIAVETSFSGPLLREADVVRHALAAVTLPDLTGDYPDRVSGVTVPVAPRVYQLLRCVPRGYVVTYGELARAAGCRSARAIGQILRRNPDAPAVPCHRVIRADLSLGGYAGAETGPTVMRKARLLAAEGVFFKKGRLSDPAKLWWF